MKRNANGSILKFFQKQNKNSSVSQTNEPNEKTIDPPDSTIFLDENVENAATKNVFPYDIINFVGKNMTMTEKVDCFKKLWVPPATFEFPFSQHHKRNLRFQYGWLNT